LEYFGIKIFLQNSFDSFDFSCSKKEALIHIKYVAKKKLCLLNYTSEDHDLSGCFCLLLYYFAYNVL